MSACLCVGLGLIDRLFVPDSTEIKILPQPHQVLSDVFSSEVGVHLGFCFIIFLHFIYLHLSIFPLCC